MTASVYAVGWRLNTCETSAASFGFAVGLHNPQMPTRNGLYTGDGVQVGGYRPLWFVLQAAC